ncbi:Gfo/Idh/MocA family oxidoreductase [uncultured Polaribacter sp.]|uniref:Gfo/Idh/MocA family protein n=1 Tax=uncultured Polaribacter sp. TaxID=174711 RepID=UPI00261758A7|nr:Gfo/Idh/MocA family oxidoreductase [uncultured Polaribacter sp.]
MASKNKLSRRRFLKKTAVGFAGISILPSLGWSQETKTPTIIRLGFIGLGNRSLKLAKSFSNLPNVEIVACCDVYARKNIRFAKKFISKTNTLKNVSKEVDFYKNYKDLISRKDVDAVVIATPDHWHALIAIEACKAGKDVYLEKPMTFTIKEGQELVKAVRKNNIILGIGSQQRSSPGFRHGISLIHNGALGKIKTVHAYVGGPPKPYDLPEENIPEDLDWDLWLGPLPKNIHFNNQLCPPISLNPPKDEQVLAAWRWYKEMGGGYTTDWGAHMFDIAQWGIGMDRSGPVRISPIGNKTEFLEFEYKNGVVMTTKPFNENKTKGVKFIGEKGWIEMSRRSFKASNKDWIPTKNMSKKPTESHYANFIQSVIERRDPIVPVEIGHSSCTVCTLGNIAFDLKKTINWDPDTQTFTKDKKATKKLHYRYRNPWKLG